MLSPSPIVLLESPVTLSQLKRKKRKIWRVLGVLGGNVCLEHFFCKWESKFNDNSQGSLCCLSDRKSDSCCIALQVFAITFPRSELISNIFIKWRSSTGSPSASYLICRHAITCGSCFDRLKSQCPMCRCRFYAPLHQLFTILDWNLLSRFDLVFQGLHQFILLVGSRAPTCTWHTTTSFSSKVLVTLAKALNLYC